LPFSGCFAVGGMLVTVLCNERISHIPFCFTVTSVTLPVKSLTSSPDGMVNPSHFHVGRSTRWS
jgi:hypothetical protein